MNARYTPTLPIIVLALVAAACGGGSDGAASTTEPAVATTSAPAAATPPASTPPASADAAPQTSAVTTSAPLTTSLTTSPATSPDEPSYPTIDELLSFGRPIVLAHTAGEDQFPASTLFGFGESAKAQVDMLDLNVQLTADNVLVVHHDDSVDRSTNGTGTVASLTYAEVAELDDAYWFTAECICTDKPAADYLYRGIRTGDVAPPAGYTADDFSIPRFRDIVTAFPDLPLNIEIKGNGQPAQAAAKVLAAEIAEFGIGNHVVVTSFDDAIVDDFHQVAPDVEVSPGLAVSTAFVLGGTPLPAGQRILQLPPEFQGLTVITDKLIADAHTSGYVIWIWPNNRDLENPATYRRYLEMGIDGLNINFPADGVAALADFLGAFG